jgi:lipoyl(octanoyl) transferase
VPYEEAWELQRSLAGAVSQGAIPDTIVLLEHPPVITLGRRAEEEELHVPEGAEVEIVETDRGGKSTYHGPGQLVCYPILDLQRHGQDVKRYCRDLEEALIRTLAPLGVEATRIEGLTGIWTQPSGDPGAPPRKIASIGIHARVRAERRPRSRSVHGVDHRLRARGRLLHDHRARARPAGLPGRGATARGRSP